MNEIFNNFKKKELLRIKKFSYIDRFIYSKLSINCVDYLDKKNITPNMITLVSFLFGLLSSLNLYFDYYTLSGICFITNYIIDCIDGPLARYSNKTSKFGDIYDHFTDILTFMLLLYVSYLKNFSVFYFFSISIFSLTTFINTSYSADYGILLYSQKIIPKKIFKNKFNQFDTAFLNMYISFYLILTSFYL